MKEISIAEELFRRVEEILDAMGGTAPAGINKMMHETLVLACHEGLRGSRQAFGSLFFQVDWLCKQAQMGPSDRGAVQMMRYHSNHREALSRDDLLYDLRALAVFISAVTSAAIPSYLTGRIPGANRPPRKGKVDERYIRCIVSTFDDTTITVSPESGDDGELLRVDYSGSAYLRKALRRGMQLNLLDCRRGGGGVITPEVIVLEPDYLVDISQIAACFQEYGHHPLLFTVNKLKERVITQPILLGNFAGSALDDIINSSADDYKLSRSVRRFFREKALDFCTCRGFSPVKFKTDAAAQTYNITKAVEILFGEYQRDKAILEPSFVCEKLGIQGRVDLMTTDFRLLVEQKSGRNMFIENGVNNQYGQKHIEAHFVQLMLYYGVLRWNFGAQSSRLDIKLLYSKYIPEEGLVVVSLLRQLFAEVMKFRNQLVATDFLIAREGFGKVLPLLTSDTLNVSGTDSSFYNLYLKPQLDEICVPLQQLSPLERAYFCRMMTFVYRESMVSKVGAQEGVSRSQADLWNMPLSEKIETGNIYTGLTITEKRRSADYRGFDTVVLGVPEQGDDFLPNFRPGDMVYLYSYGKNETPDVRRAILHRATITEIASRSITVHLANAQQNPDIISGYRFAIEHGGGDVSSVQGLYEFVTAPRERRDLILGQRRPRRDTSLRLSKGYNPDYDDILLRVKQAKDYFLLVGPPGTGKTSMALRFIVEEELASADDAAVLLMAYTNRAVDEICDMLIAAKIDFLRIASPYSCDARFAPFLVDSLASGNADLSHLRLRLSGKRVIAGTTSMIQSRQYLFDLKAFSLAVVDEASQILEPGLAGLLAAHRNSGRCRISRFVLIGDYKQLPAVVQQSEAESAVSDPLLLGIGLSDCRNSLFERLIMTERRCCDGDSPFTGVLRRSGRMHPEVAEFVNSLFYFDDNLLPVPCPHQLEGVLHYDNVAEEDELDGVLLRRRMVFLPSVPCRRPDLSDKVNVCEAEITADVLRRIRRYYGPDFDPLHSVGVIVPYRNQIAMIRKQLELLHIPELLDVSIDTVERYQGSQRDVIIYSFTVQRLYQLEFLTSNRFVEKNHIIDRKLNVALTRARKQMIIIGNEEILNSDEIFARLVEFVKKKNSDTASDA